MSNYKTKSNDIVRCKDCSYNPSFAEGFVSKCACPLAVVVGSKYYFITPNDNWFCANGGYRNSNDRTTANNIIRCKDCIYNPSRIQ